MSTTSNRTSRLAGFIFAAVMAVAINGGMLMTFNGVATDAYLAQSTPSGHVTVLATVTVVGHRI